MTLLQLWETTGRRLGTKVRYRDWDHKIQYFVIEEYDTELGTFTGSLDTGEKITYDKSSYPWKSYSALDIHAARAV